MQFFNKTTIYIAEVAMASAENNAVVPYNGIYKYSALLYYKQFSPIPDSDNYTKDTALSQYKVSENSITLLSATDLSTLLYSDAELQTVVVPCINKGGHFENILISPIVPKHKQAWDVSFSDSTVTCTDCVYTRGPLTIDCSSSVSGQDDVYIAAHVNLDYGTATLVIGTSIADVTDQSPQNDDTLVKILLYHAVKDSTTWSIDMDYRSIPQLGVRI